MTLPVDWQAKMVEMIRGASPADGDWFTGNDRVTPVEQIEIYQEQYRFRMWDAVVDDIPGLYRLLGDDEAERVIWAYLADCPPRDWTLTRTTDRLAGWLAEHGAPPEQVELARFDYAVTHGFDAPEGQTPRPDELQSVLAGDVRLRLQPHVQLLRLSHDVHAFRSAVVNETEPGPVRTGDWRLALYRFDLKMRHLELEPGAFAVLDAFAQGGDLGTAIEAALNATGDPAVLQARLGGWFALFVEQGLVELDR